MTEKIGPSRRTVRSRRRAWPSAQRQGVLHLCPRPGVSGGERRARRRSAATVSHGSGLRRLRDLDGRSTSAGCLPLVTSVVVGLIVIGETAEKTAGYPFSEAARSPHFDEALDARFVDGFGGAES